MSTTAAGSTTLEPPVGAEHVGVLPVAATRVGVRVRSRAALAVGAIAVLGVAFAVLEQNPGPTPVSHFALVRALSHGTAEIGPGVTIDSAYIDGRYFANKAPGLAFALLPPYMALRAVGVQAEQPGGGEVFRSSLRQLTLLGAVLPAVALLLLMAVAVEWTVPGYGGLTAILLGAGTMLLPFATLLFGHMLSATLGFAAFVVLLRERRREPSVALVALAGLLAGYAVVVEYPLGIVALVLAGYVASGARVGARLSAYLAACAVGALPLALYNTWAFGSPTTMSYTNVLNAPSDGGGSPTLGGGNSTGFYGVSLPDLRVALSLLFSEKGLFVVTPICLAALIGLPALWRIGKRREAAVCTAIPALFLAYNASYYLPFGGQGPGPRFLVPALPFLALPLAAALARWLWPTLALGLVSVAVMALATATSPQITGADHSISDWASELAHGEVAATVLPLDGRLGTLALGLLLVLALGLAVASASPSRDALRPTPLAALVVAAWIVVAVAVPHLLPAEAVHGTRAGTLAAVCVVGALAAAVVLVVRRGPRAAVALTPLAALLLPAVQDRQNLALLLSVTTLALVALTAIAARMAAGRSLA